MYDGGVLKLVYYMFRVQLVKTLLQYTYYNIIMSIGRIRCILYRYLRAPIYNTYIRILLCIKSITIVLQYFITYYMFSRMRYVPSILYE